jgi:hypothetical protein
LVDPIRDSFGCGIHADIGDEGLPLLEYLGPEATRFFEDSFVDGDGQQWAATDASDVDDERPMLDEFLVTH